MPVGGARPGAGRPRGRTGGDRDIRAVRQEIEAQRQALGYRRGIAILQEFANYYRNMAAKFAPTGTSPDEAKFEKFSKIACNIAADLAPYESPKLASIAVTEVPYDLSRLTDAQLRELDRITKLAAIAGVDPAGVDS